MRIPNILRQFGGVDIKLKNRMAQSVKMIIIIFLGCAVCYGLYFIVDNVLNGVFLDWFESTFMTESYTGDIYIREPDWHKIKYLALVMLCANVALWVVTIFAVSERRVRKCKKGTITGTSRMIKDYMDGDRDASDIFPSKYAEISAQMTEIKSSMERHERILKEEAGRKNDLIAYLAHDLKTPLTSVIGYLSLLDEASDMPKEQRAKYLNITLDKAQRLEKLINEFFEITRYNLMQIEILKERIDLYFMLVQMTDEFYPILSGHSNTVELQADENLIIWGDPDKLSRVFNNILKNAIAYSYENSIIEISAECTENEVRILFRNKGRTIPEQKLNLIFEKFFRLDDARNTNTGGAGLGLAIAKEIAELHGGSITAESKDEITEFCVVLPIKS